MKEYIIVTLLAFSLVALGASAYLFVEACEEVDCHTTTQSVNEQLVEEEFGEMYFLKEVREVQCDPNSGTQLIAENNEGQQASIMYGCGEYVVRK